MRGTLARMPNGLRLAMGFATALIFLFFGNVFLDEGRHTLGYILVGLGVFRLLLLVRSLLWRSRRRRRRQ